MDAAEYTALVGVLAAVPDPRQRRGQRYRWAVLLTLVVAAVLSGEQHGRGIGQWVREHGAELRERLGLVRVPSEATLRRVVRRLDGGALEQQLSHWAATHVAQPDRAWVGVALDGKEVRGARHHGRPVVLVSLARHDGVVLDQEAIPSQRSEGVAARRLVTRHALVGRVVTADAGLAERALAATIRAPGGHYLLVIKGNQPQTQQAIAELFRCQPWTMAERPAHCGVQRTLTKGHGRLETRVLAASDWLDWPDVGQVLQRTTRRVQLGSGVVQETVSYAVTSLTPREADPATLERLWRGHWSIENRVHHVRDVSLGEDAGQAYQGSTPHALAAVRNAVLTLLRLAGWTRIADAVRHDAAQLDEALALIGATSGL